MSAAWETWLVGMDMATTVCASVNLAYFLSRVLFGQEESAPRRVAACVLALVSFGALLESAFLLASAAADGGAPAPDDGTWALVRAVPFAGMACMSALVVRGAVEA